MSNGNGNGSGNMKLSGATIPITALALIISIVFGTIEITGSTVSKEDFREFSRFQAQHNSVVVRELADLSIDMARIQRDTLTPEEVETRIQITGQVIENNSRFIQSLLESDKSQSAQLSRIEIQLAEILRKNN